MSQDIISDALNQIMNAKRARKKELAVKRYSNFLLNLLNLMKKQNFLDYRINGRALEIEIKKLNECKAIKPRFNVSVGKIDKYMRRFLPSKDFGYIFISTSKGLMTHNEAVEKNLGGSLIAYAY